MTLRVCTIPAIVLRGLLRVAPTRHKRHELIGVYVDPEHHTLTATNGKSMLLVRRQFDAVCPPFIVSRKICEEALKGATHWAPNIVVTVEGSEPRQRAVKLASRFDEISETELKLHYPNYRSCVPIRTSGVPAVYDRQLFNHLKEAIELVTEAPGIDVQVECNGHDPALVCCARDNVLGVLQSQDAPVNHPAWPKAALLGFGFKPYEPTPPITGGTQQERVFGFAA